MYWKPVWHILSDGDFELVLANARHVISDVLGRSGRAMIDALIAGETDPDKLAALAQRGSRPRRRLREALRGRVTEHHRFLLRLHLRQIDALGAAIAEIDREVDRALDPFRAVGLLAASRASATSSAQVIIAEIGIDMSRFPTAGHLISWAGPVPAERRERRQAALHPACARARPGSRPR